MNQVTSASLRYPLSVFNKNYTLKKDTPSFGKEDLEERHRSGTEAGLLGVYNFPGSVHATDGSNDKGVMEAGFFKLDEHRGGCC